MLQEYDVIVVGGGHAGNEAAAAAANLGSSVLMITMNMNTIGQMSCNPAMGGIAKGQIVREIDAMGGYSGIVSDRSAIQFRMLNRSKGPAMWSPRTQNDRMLFANEWRLMLEQTPNCDFWQDMVTGLLIDGDRVSGVKTSMGMTVKSKSVILTNGTFLNGIIHLGEKQFGGGRAGERAAHGITEQLVDLGFESGRMKTGTPPRIDGRSLDYSKMEEQPGDDNPDKFSYSDTKPLAHQRPCHITYTNTTVHDILRTGFEQSPMFSGRIQGLGPRYCPSIEDKIERFSDKDQHQLFVEPEGWDTVEIYVNGFSTSLPEEVQMKALQQVPGFEQCKMFRPGYAIEYDFFQPTQLDLTLQTKLIKNLYFAGQINGTTGYEEAACQGLIAGINAHRSVKETEPFILKRSEAYIGVLIDDLVNKGTKEPYRMFTSRAEYRILLRQDNADERLTPLAHSIGLASNERMERVAQKIEGTKGARKYFSNQSVAPEDINSYLDEIGSAPLKQKVKLETILSRPHVTLSDLANHFEPLKQYADSLQGDSVAVLQQTEIQIKYEGYINKEQEMADKLSRLEDVRLPQDLPYHQLGGLSAEAKEKLSRQQPQSIGQASRISGISPSDISVLLVYMGR
ncbi:MAG: tRNA uridine-5-carboxymethylaminomethyl(34) synthesis enzyme MnmG [Flavobacteriales bacterium]|nr:tRNA uridine-5-carboxymethylaminomethyl(34) synthesis enzyme MnmG [Flavobacteriales bacterium]